MKLLDLLWQYGFRRLLLGFCITSMLILVFFGLELKRMQEIAINFGEKLEVLYGDQITCVKNDLTEAYKQIIENLRLNKNVMQKLENKIDRFIIYDDGGCIKDAFNIEYKFVLPFPILKEGFKILDDHLILVKPLQNSTYLHLQIAKKIDSTIFINRTYIKQQLEKVKKYKFIFYVIMIVVFLFIVFVFIVFSWWIIYLVSSKILINLNKLLKVENYALKNDIDAMQDVDKIHLKPNNYSFEEIMFVLKNDIDEFAHVSKTLLDHIQHLQKQNIFIRTVLDNIASAIVVVRKEDIGINKAIRLANNKGKNLLALGLEKLLTQITSTYYLDLDGKRFSVVVVPFDDQVMFVLDDITDRVSLEKQIAWRDVARVIAHEVKNPLTPTKLAAEQMLSLCADNRIFDSTLLKRNQNYLKTIIRNVDHINKLIDDFAHFTKQVQAKPNFIHFDINELMFELLESNKLVYPNLCFIYRSRSIMVCADRSILQQVYGNAIQNAAQACVKSGGIVHIQFHKKIEHLVCVIVDNGVGLKMDVKTLMNPYVTTKEYGTGLGLSVIQRGIRAHNGFIQMTNRKGKSGCVIVLSIRTDCK